MKRVEYIIKIYLKPGDKAKIAKNARECGMSMSAYVRNLALGDIPVTHIELDEMNKVMKVHADLGRLCGLLKMTLTNDERLNDTRAAVPDAGQWTAALAGWQCRA